MRGLDKIRKDPRVDEVIDEGDDGIWIYLKNGYYNHESGTKCIHEHTIQKCIEEMSNIRKVTKEQKSIYHPIEL